MKEFIDKLIGRLEEEKKYCSYNPQIRDEAINKAISIVTELAEEYNGCILVHAQGLDVGIQCAMCTNSMKSDTGCDGGCSVNKEMYKKVLDVIDRHTQNAPYTENNVSEMPTGWIPCSERLPQVETEVYIVAKRKYRDGGVRYIATTAMYEDGTVNEEDSAWVWYDIEGEWDEEHDCYKIPQGWWEYKHYNHDDCYNNAIDDEVIAWMPLPAPYTEGE